MTKQSKSLTVLPWLLVFGLLLSLGFGAGCRRVIDSIKDSVETKPQVEEKAKPVEDTDYRFKLSAPSANWKVMPEAEAQKLAPASVAAAVDSSTNVFGVVIVEHLPGLDLPTFVSLVTDQMALDNKKIELKEDLQFQGQAATRVVLSGELRGIALRYAVTLFLHQGYGFQLLAWGSLQTTKSSDLDPFFNAFSLLPGEIKGRQISTPTRDTVGVGFRVKGGVFESAVTGLRVSPPAGFRVMIGGELEIVNAAAQVGWVRQAPEVYSIILTERIPPGGFESMRDMVQKQFRASLGTSQAKGSFEQPVMGAARTFEIIEGDSGFTYTYGVFSTGTHLLQVVGWYPKANAEQGLKEFQAGLVGLDQLEETARNALKQELSVLPDSQNSVGPEYALRRGLYLDFANRLRWQAPNSGIWKILAGPDARAQEAASILYLVEELSTTYGALMLKEGVSDAAAHHQEVLAAYPNVRVTKTTTLDTNSGSAGTLHFQVAHGEAAADGVHYSYMLASSIDRGKGLTFLFWGMQGLLDESIVQSALNGLSAPANLSMTETKGSEYADHRFGFAVKLPAAWKFQNVTPQDVAPLGTVVSFNEGLKTITVVALTALSAGQDETWFNEFLQGLMKNSLKDLEQKPIESELRFLDHPARETIYKSLLKRVDVLVFTRDRTSFALITDDVNEETVGIARSAFHLEP